jgi:hypothetical protein
MFWPQIDIVTFELLLPRMSAKLMEDYIEFHANMGYKMEGYSWEE